MTYKSPVQLAGSEEPFVCPQALVLNPYKGCSYNCSYCYAKWIMQMFGQWKLESTSLDIVKKEFEKAFDGSRSRLSKLIRQKIPLRFSNLTDPFQPIEKKKGLTYDILEYLKEIDYPVILNTKGVIQSEPKYLDLLEDMKVVVQETIITLDDELTKKLEPNAPLPDKRIDTLDKLDDRGIKTQVRYSPVFPLLNDEPKELFERVSNVGVNDVISEYIRLPLDKRRKMIDDCLGYDYLQYLEDEDYPMIKTQSWYKVDKDKLFSEYKRHKSIAEEKELDYLICCEEKPEINNWRNCCGTDKYEGFSGMDWTIQMRGKVIDGDETSFDEYMDDLSCPYKNKFKEYWEEGKLEDNLTGMSFKDGKYKREKDETYEGYCEVCGKKDKKVRDISGDGFVIGVCEDCLKNRR